MKPKILVADDEPDMLNLVAANLRAAGWDVHAVGNGAAAIEAVQNDHPELIVLDLMLPGLSGLEVCRMLKGDPSTSCIPIVMLTAKAEEVDRIVGLELGADDYITKPFSPRELVLRIKNVLRRSSKTEPVGTVLTMGPIVLDRERFQVTIAGKTVDFTATELKLLTLLMERRGRVQSREVLLNDVWGYESLIDTRTVDTHVRRLREKLGPAADYLETVRGFGYRFSE